MSKEKIKAVMPVGGTSVGNISNINYAKSPKRQTLKVRGTGAATKGKNCSDKMG